MDRAWCFCILPAVLICAEIGEGATLPSLPDREGFAGMMAGVSNGALIVAGGANFPGKRPWEGGKKIWHENVFVLADAHGEWKAAGKLPRPLAYATSVSYDGSVICVGGSDATRHYADAFRLEWNHGTVLTTELPPLPKAVANACGAVVDDVLYVAGGQESPDARNALNEVWSLDLSATPLIWKRIDPFPGAGRILSVATSFDGAFWIVGGVRLSDSGNGQVKRHYLRDAFRYDPVNGWTRVAELPGPLAAAPSPAPTGERGFYVLGGDDGSQASVEPEMHRGFSRRVLSYDSQQNTWNETAKLDNACVTAPCVLWNDVWVVCSGEIRPGVRSPKVWAFAPPPMERLR